MKQRIYTLNGYTCEIIGPPNKCLILINGEHTGTVFNNIRFPSVKKARLRFLTWVKNKPVKPQNL